MVADKKMAVVVAFLAFLALNGVVDGSPLCRYWLLTCCCGNSQEENVNPAIASAVYKQFPSVPAGASEGPRPIESNEIPGEVSTETEIPNAVQPTTSSEPSEGGAVLPVSGPSEGDVVPSVSGLRVARNTPPSDAQFSSRFKCLGGCAQVQAANARAVSVGYPQPVGNARAEGYTSYPGFGAYKVHRVGVAWYDALRVCASEGGTLVVVNSQAEADLLKTMFSNEEVPDAVNNMHFWVGAQERGVDGQFYTVYGDRLEQSGYMSWSHYAGGQPNDRGNTDCVSIFVEGTYFDDECSSKYAFVCENIL